MGSVRDQSRTDLQFAEMEPVNPRVLHSVPLGIGLSMVLFAFSWSHTRRRRFAVSQAGRGRFEIRRSSTRELTTTSGDRPGDWLGLVSVAIASGERTDDLMALIR